MDERNYASKAEADKAAPLRYTGGQQVSSFLGNSIGWAVKQLYDGARVSRYGWNGRDMYIQLQVPDPGSKMTLPYVYMKTADGNLVPWLCSQTDLLAMDWNISNFSVKGE